jgi:hypothetical protein
VAAHPAGPGGAATRREPPLGTPHESPAELPTESPAESSARLGHHIFLVPGILLAALSPWLLEVDNRLQAALIGAQILLCAIGVVRCYVNGFRPMGMVFFVFLLSWLGVGPLYQLAHSELAWNDSGLLRRTDLVTAALGLTLAMTAVAATTLWLTSSGVRSVRPPDAGADARARRSQIWGPRTWTPWAFLGVLVLLTPYVVATNGGLSSLFSSRDARVSDLSAAGITVEQSGGTQVALAVILPAALSVAATHLFIARIRSSGRGRRLGDVALLDALGLAGSLLGMVLFTNPLSNTRFISIAAFGSVALALLAPRTPRAGRWTALLLGVATLGVYPLSNALASDPGTAAGQSPLAVFAGKDFDGFQQIVNSIVYVHDAGYSLGRYTISALFFFVPRSLWHWKATPSAIDVAAHRGYWFTNLSMPVHSEVFLEFGLVGVLAFAVALGYAWARIDTAWLTRPAGISAWLVPYMSLAELGFIRGPLGSLAPVWLSGVLLLAAGVRRRPVPQAVPEPDPPLRPPASALLRMAAPQLALSR